MDLQVLTDLLASCSSITHDSSQIQRHTDMVSPLLVRNNLDSRNHIKELGSAEVACVTSTGVDELPGTARGTLTVTTQSQVC